MCNFWPWGEPTLHYTSTMANFLKTSHNFVHFPCVSVKNTYTMGICVSYYINSLVCQSHDSSEFFFLRKTGLWAPG
jgi:hypothetical protein